MNSRVENTENVLQQKYLIPTENLHIIITLNPHSRKKNSKHIILTEVLHSHGIFLVHNILIDKFLQRLSEKCLPPVSPV